MLEYDPDAGYDDQVIEALYQKVFEDQNINLKPTTQIPLHLNTYFNGNTILDRFRIPMPHSVHIASPESKGQLWLRFHSYHVHIGLNIWLPF